MPTQNLEASLAALSEASGVPLAKCEVHRHDLGGGFGRRGGTQDYVHQAVAIAKEFPGVPVKLIWSREEDQAHDFYRPISQCKLSAGLDATASSSACTSACPASRSTPCSIRPASSAARTCASCRAITPSPATRSSATRVPNLLIEYAMRNTHVPVGPWRGVNTNQNAVYMECFMDEVAKAAGKDPLEFRRALMEELSQASRRAQRRGREGRLGQAAAGRRASRHRAVHGLRQLLGRRRRSLGQPQGKLKVHRMVLALNCGHAVNPSQIAAQVAGLGRLSVSPPRSTARCRSRRAA